MIRRSHSRMSGKNLKRSGSPQSPPLPTKAPKIKNMSKKNNTSSNNVMMAKIESPPLPTKAPKIKNMSKKNNTTSNNVMMAKIEKIEEKLENYESSNKDMKVALASNMAAIDGLNTKLDKISQLLGVLTENGGKMNESYPETKIFYSFYGNIMTCESFFDMEGLMTNYGITGKNVTSQILSYLDFDSMVAARMVSKTWYRFLEDERGLWITLMKKCFEDIKEKSTSSRKKQREEEDNSSKEWLSLIELVMQKGDVSDMIGLVERILSPTRFYEWEKRLPAQNIPDQSGRNGMINFTLDETAKEDIWKTLKYFKVLLKHKFLQGLESDSPYREKKYYASKLLFWSLRDMEAFEFVLPLVQNYAQFQMISYTQSCDPIWGAIRLNDEDLTKLQMLIPLATKKFWNSGKPIGSVDHTPLADAIMIGNVEMVRTIMPLTKLKANPKNRFGSYLHVAVRYGQFEIFKIIFKHLKGKKFDWLQLKDQEERTALEMLQDENFQLENYNRDLEKPVRADRDESKKYKQHMLKFIENLM